MIFSLYLSEEFMFFKSTTSSFLKPGIYPLLTYAFEVKDCVLLKGQSSYKDSKLNLLKEELPLEEHPRLTYFDWGSKGRDRTLPR